jgi:hypothetical protein
VYGSISGRKKDYEIIWTEPTTFPRIQLLDGQISIHLGPKKAILSDANSELIDTYRAMQEKFCRRGECAAEASSQTQ